MKRLEHRRIQVLIVILCLVIVAGSVDGGLYLSSKRPASSPSSASFVRLTAQSAIHPVMGLALPFLCVARLDGLGGFLGLLAVLTTALVVLAARHFLIRGTWKALGGVLTAGLFSYWLSTRLLYGVLYGPAWF
jgi:hypothetical protein